MSAPITDQPIRGTEEEKRIYWEAKRHYEMSRQDLETRYRDFDRKDELFRSFIPDIDSKGQKWPYSAQVFDPRVFTAIFEKSARLLANKPRGRMEPRESGDVLGAKINSEILNFQWDESEKVDDTPMLAKWAMMDQNARKYGASFALAKWHYEKHGDKVFYDGPTMKVWNNRDVLHNPSYSHIKNWIQLREYVTFDELKNISDTKGKPIYKNLDILRDSLLKSLNEKGNTGRGDSRENNWRSKNLAIKGLQDYLGKDEVFPTIEVVTEYRSDRWITFAPKHGVILRDIPNPYKHGLIPVIMLKYYPVDEDIYGLSEIEPIEKLQKATNAALNQYLDAINISLYPIVKVRTSAVQMHTLEWGIGKKWLMSDPSTDVVEQQTRPAGVGEFPLTYRILVGAMQEAMGETSQGVSNITPGEGEKTATEIRDTAGTRNARDNFNQIFLGEAITKQMMLWYSMNQQLMFDNKPGQQKVIRVVGMDAVEFFMNYGLADTGFTDQTIDGLASPEMAETVADPNFNLSQFESPLYPIQTPDGSIPKFVPDDVGGGGSLVVEPSDLDGAYDYVVEVRSMENPDPARVQALTQTYVAAKDPAAAQLRAQEGKYLSIVDVEKDLWEILGLKDAAKYYKPIPMIGGVNGQETGVSQQGGAGIPAGAGEISQPAGVGGVQGPPPAVFAG